MQLVLLASTVLICTSTYAASALLTWSAPTHNTNDSPLTNLAGYRVYSGCSESGQYELPPITLGLVTSYNRNDLPDAPVCYFAVTAFDTSGSESAFSAEASKPFAQQPPQIPDAPAAAPLVAWQESQVMATQTLVIVDTLDDVLYNGSLYTGFLQWGIGNYAGMSFIATAAIPAGSTINSAYVRVFRTNVDSGTGTARIAVEDAAFPNTRFSAGHPVQSATVYAYVETASVNWIDYQNQWVFGSGDALQVAVTAGIQALIDEHGAVAIDDRINIQILGTGSGSFARAEDYGDAGTNHAQLFIDWTASGGAAIPRGPMNGIMLAGPLQRVVGP